MAPRCCPRARLVHGEPTRGEEADAATRQGRDTADDLCRTDVQSSLLSVIQSNRISKASVQSCAQRGALGLDCLHFRHDAGKLGRSFLQHQPWIFARQKLTGDATYSFQALDIFLGFLLAAGNKRLAEENAVSKQ